MKFNGKTLVVTLLVVATVGIGLFAADIHYDNADVKLRNRAASQEDIRKIVHDTMWKILKDKAGVTEEYAEKFGEIYPELIEGRYSSGGGLMKFIQESNPDFDTSLYQDLMVSIEAQRTEFFNAQKELRNIKESHDDLIGTKPGKWFVDNQTPIEVDMITSTSTEATFESGIDDQTLFDN